MLFDELVKIDREKSAQLQHRVDDLKKNKKTCDAVFNVYSEAEACSNVTIGCKWSEWTNYGVCVDGKTSRTRSRLPTPWEGTCQGKDTEEAGCVEQVGQWWTGRHGRGETEGE